MRRHDHHPVLEYLVFGLAIALFCVLMFHGIKRLSSGGARGAQASSQPPESKRKPGELTPPAETIEDVNRPYGNLVGSGTSGRVARLPAVKGSPAPVKKSRKPRF